MAPSVTLMRNIFENAFTMGLVMSLAKPQRAKQLVMRINGTSMAALPVGDGCWL